MFAMYTDGTRKECRLVDRTDVSMSAATVRFREVTTKNGTERVVPLPPELVKVLRALPSPAKDAAVSERDGQRMTANQIRAEFERIVRKVPPARFRLHDLRHAWATDLAMEGVPLRRLMDLNGWKSLDMVQRYAAAPRLTTRGQRRRWGAFLTRPAPLPHHKTRHKTDQGIGTVTPRESKAGAEDRT
jgi:integrase